METEHKLYLSAEEINERLQKVPVLDIFRNGIQDGDFIRVSIEHAAYDGMEIKFKSPVDCQEITKLRVEYPGVGNSSVFEDYAFVDALGQDLGEINELFSAGAIVKVVLDRSVEDGIYKAFVQNAATSAYLETQLTELRTSVNELPSYVDQKVAELIDSAPETLNTLNELADALGNDPNFATTIVTEIGAKTTYSNSEPLLSNIGGIQASEHTNGFDNVPITDLITELLYPYTEPVINSFTLNPGAGVKEKNVALEVKTASVKVTKKSKAIESVSLYKGSSLVETKNDEIASTGTTLTFTINETLDGSANTTYQVRVAEKNGKTKTSDATYSFVYPYFYGIISGGASVDSDTILAFTKSVRAKGSHSYSYTTNNQCPVIAYPKEYGDLKSIVDPNNFTQNWTKTVVNVNNGTTIKGIDYYVYVGGASTATAAYKFNY